MEGAVLKPRMPNPLLLVSAILAATVLGLIVANADDHFPPIDPAKLRITLQRSACFGECPDYSVTIFGDGRVSFATRPLPVDEVAEVHRDYSYSPGVLVQGRHEDRVAPAVVAALVEQFRAARFFTLKSSYRAMITDNPTYVLTLDTGNGAKTVVDYVGQKAGMPKAVSDLEKAVDRAAGTDRWVRGAAALIPWLEEQKFDFRSEEAARIAAAGGSEADEATIIALIDRGAPLAARVPGGKDGKRYGDFLVEAAIARGSPALFRRLGAAGWLDRFSRQRAGERFAASAAACSPAFVDAAADAGLDNDQPQPVNAQGDWDETGGNTALASLASSYDCDDPGKDRLATARRLLARGADPNHRNALGRTPLYGVEQLDLLELLLTHGADPRIKGKDGNGPVFGSWTETIVLRLLEAGASPAGKNEDGATLAELARKRHMAGVVRWLKDHPASSR